MDALDHMPPATDAPRYVRLVQEACPNVQARHSTLPAFFEEAERRARRVPTRRGELREPSKNRCPYLWLIPNCVSSRVRLKQANDLAQSLLEQWAEPLVALANIQGADIPKRFLEIAWETLLLNHAHDSICGCSIDQVHRDMMYRFDQVRILADQLRNRALGALTAPCRDPATGDDEFSVVVFNPVPLPRREVVVFDIDFPPDYPAFFHEGFSGSQNIKAFTLHAPDGGEVPYQRISISPRLNERTRYARPALSTQGDFDRYRVAAELDLPPLGFTTLVVRPSDRPVRRVGSLRTGPASAENEFIALSFAPNGTLTLTDKTTGETYRDLLTFEDRSEIGDGWFHAHTVTDQVILSSASPAQVAVVADGPDLVAFRVEVALDVPARYDRRTERRSAERAKVLVSSVVSLRRGSRVVEVETAVENKAEDHRLRLLLPTDIPEARTWLAHHPFDLVERPIAIDPETASWQEMEQAEKPFLGLQAVGAGKRGLAFLSAGGVHEGGVADDRRRTMTVTLLRSYRRTVATAGETDGLELTTLTYRYGLMPFAGELPREEALFEMAKLQAGVLTRQSGPRPSGFPPMSGKGEPHAGFIELKRGRLVPSAIKPPEDGSKALVVRLWNPADEPASDTLTFWRPVAGARRVNLAEDEVPDPVRKSGKRSVTVQAGPHEIVTVRVEFA